MHKIRNGLSVELIWITKKAYLNEVKEITGSWFGVGSEKLLPVYGKKFIDKLNRYKPNNVKQKALEQAAAL